MRLHRVIPNEVLAVIAVLGVLGGYTLYQGLRPLPDVLDAASTESGRIVVAVVILLLLVAAFGAACLAIAYLLARADRVGRGLAYAMALALGISALLENNSEGGFSSDDSSTWQIVIVLGSIAAAALLGLPAASRQFFTGPTSRDHNRPVSVVVVQVLITCIGSLVALSGALYLLIGSYKHSYYAIGLGLLALAGGYAVGYQLLRNRDPRAPIVTTAVAGIAILLQLVAGSDITGFVLGVGPQVMIVVLLWASRDAVTFFGRTPTWLNGLPTSQGGQDL
jgi:hypothetical protein